MAFRAVIKSFVDDVVMPPIRLVTGGVDFAQRYALLKDGMKSPPPYASLAAAQDAGGHSRR